MDTRAAAPQTPVFDGPWTATQVIPFILENFAETISLDDLAREAGLSRFKFCRRFHQECGVPPMRWLWNFRVLLAAEFISLDPQWSLTDVAFACGFTSSAHFSRSFRAMFRRSPSQYRKAALAKPVRTTPAFDGLFGDNSALVLRAARAAIVGG